MKAPGHRQSLWQRADDLQDNTHRVRPHANQALQTLRWSRWPSAPCCSPPKCLSSPLKHKEHPSSAPLKSQDRPSRLLFQPSSFWRPPVPPAVAAAIYLPSSMHRVTCYPARICHIARPPLPHSTWPSSQAAPDTCRLSSASCRSAASALILVTCQQACGLARAARWTGVRSRSHRCHYCLARSALDVLAPLNQRDAYARFCCHETAPSAIGESRVWTQNAGAELLRALRFVG